MAGNYQHLLGYLSNVILHTKNSKLDITDNILEINVSENLFSSYVKGSIKIIDTPSFRIYQLLTINGGPETKIEFSFSGAEGKNKNIQQKIEINKDNYCVYKIDFSETVGNVAQYCIIHFIHKNFYLNKNKKISISFSNKKISKIIEILGKKLELQWNEIEQTQNNLTTTLPYNSTIDHITTLTKYAIRKKNKNDVNYCFWQNIEGKYNFVSLGELFSRQSTFGDNVNNGFLYSNINSDNYEITRKLTSNYSPIVSPVLEGGLAGLYGSSYIYVDKFNSNGFFTNSYDLKNEWEKQTHLSNNKIINFDSDILDYINPSFMTRVYCIDRHTYCCNEKKGGQRNYEYVIPRRLSQLAQFFQLGIEFYCSGNSNTKEISVGNIIYFGRPLVAYPENFVRNDIFYTGKYLITSIKHIIKKQSNLISSYSCKIRCYKDSIGEE